MSDSEPEKIPGQGGNGPFVVVAVLLALVLGGLVFFKMRAAPEGTKPVASVTPEPVKTVAKPALTDSIPPPPDEEKPAEETPDAGTKKPATTTGGGNGACGGTCTGTPTSGTSADLRGRSAVARGCYERALRTNSSLQGKITVSVRVDPNGNVCSASAGSDSLHAPDVTACILSSFRGQHVAAPTGGCADSSLTLNFEPKNKLSCGSHDLCCAPFPRRARPRRGGARRRLRQPRRGHDPPLQRYRQARSRHDRRRQLLHRAHRSDRLRGLERRERGRR